MKRILSLTLILAGLLTGSAYSACVDHGVWEKVLKANVDKDGYIDYDGIRINKGGDLYEYIAIIEDVSIRGCTEAEQAAFWINAYNAHLVRLILARPQLAKANEDPTLLEEKFKLARMDLNLNLIYHRILRSDPAKGGPVPDLSLPKFNPLTHFAINTGAIDSPKMINKAYQPQALDAMLQASALSFANNPKYLRLENNTLVANGMLKEYGADFEKIGGAANLLISLTDSALRKDASKVDQALKTNYPEQTDFRYNWTLNSARNKPAGVK